VILDDPTGAFFVAAFELSCNRGAPSYNLGYAYGRFALANHIGVYHVSYWSEGECNIVFTFETESVHVEQIGLDFDCGFGHGVYADGDYSLVDDRPPVLGCMYPENPCTPTPVLFDD
jgi:hypothetical protein